MSQDIKTAWSGNTPLAKTVYKNELDNVRKECESLRRELILLRQKVQSLERDLKEKNGTKNETVVHHYNYREKKPSDSITCSKCLHSMGENCNHEDGDCACHLLKNNNWFTKTSVCGLCGHATPNGFLHKCGQCYHRYEGWFLSG